MASGGKPIVSNQSLRKWMAWRDDYRCARPPVSCQGCEKNMMPLGKPNGAYFLHFPSGKGTALMVFQGFNLVRCSECEKPKADPQILVPHVYKRVFRDVACRYIARFGGSTFMVQTDADDAEIYLRNPHGEVIATVSMFDRFPKQVDENELADIPF